MRMQNTFKREETNASHYDSDFVEEWSAEMKVHRNELMCLNDMQCAREPTKELCPTTQSCGHSDDYIAAASAKFSVIQVERLYISKSLGETSNSSLAHIQSELSQVLPILDEKTPGEFIKCRNFGEYWNDILFISKVHINDHVNGHAFARCLVQNILDNFADGSYRVVLKPFPLHCHTRDVTETQFHDVWESMGFKQLCDSEYWGRCQSYSHPQVELP